MLLPLRGKSKVRPEGANSISYVTNYGEFYEYIDVIEISDSVGGLMRGESGRITRAFDRKRDIMVIY